MAYEYQWGTYTVFKNERKQKETHPDYTGSGVDLNGVECWVNIWVNKPQGKKPFLSISTRAKDEAASEKATSEKPASENPSAKASPPEKDEDLPF